jgi:hypothetical protein
LRLCSRSPRSSGSLGILEILGIKNRKPEGEGREVSLSARTHVRARVCTNAHCFAPGNFKKDATVRLSHGRLHSHRPSENVRVTTLYRSLITDVNIDTKTNNGDNTPVPICTTCTHNRHVQTTLSLVTTLKIQRLPTLNLIPCDAGYCNPISKPGGRQ